MTDAERLALLETIGREILAAQDALNAAPDMWTINREASRRTAALLELRAALDARPLLVGGTEEGA